MTRPALRVVACSAALFAGIATGCGRPVAVEECRTLVEHYADLLAKQEEPGASPERVARVQTEARALVERDPKFELTECAQKVSRGSYECAIRADSVDAVERCLIF